MKRILEHCTAAEVPYKTIPGVAELWATEEDLARSIRDVAVEDLLGRAPVSLDQDRISAKLRNKTILVTGAAGSIGSEICRQIARFRPGALIGFDIAESPVFHLQGEIIAKFPGSRPSTPKLAAFRTRPGSRRCWSSTGPPRFFMQRRTNMCL